MLISKGASVATADNLGRTALHLACERGAQANVFTQFVTECFTEGQAGDAINAVTNNGCTPLHYASYYNRGYYIVCLLEHGAKLEARNNAGQTPLHMVGLKISKVRSGEEGRAISDDLGDTAVASDAMEVENDYDSDEGLPYAVSDDNVYLELLKQGADITARDNMGNLPFFLAAATEWLEATFEILRLGAVQGLFEKNHR